MKASQFFISTLKEAPADAEVVSHKLMMRAGLIKKLGAGIYNYMPMGLRVIRKSQWQADLYDLISAYGQIKARTEPAVHVIAHRPVMTLEDALVRLERMIGTVPGWSTLKSFMPESADGGYRKSALASSFVAAAACSARACQRGMTAACRGEGAARTVKR